MPIDITDVWNTFYTVFETDRRSKWRNILEKRIPIRIGSMSDSFMFMDKKYKVTQELLKLLNFYNYPYIIFTRSDLIAHDEYLSLLNEDLCSIQMSIASTNDKMNKLIEPGTPSSKRRLKALEKLQRGGFWTTVRLNPFFPIFPDGYFTNPSFDRSGNVQKFDFSSFEMIDEIASYGVPSILAGFVRLSPFAMNQIEKVVGVNLRSFFIEENRRGKRDYQFSDQEIRAYYERIHAKCKQNSIQFTTCYIGNGENHFWKDQDLWDNKKDCCNAKNRIKEFKTSSREINWYERLRHTPHKCSTPNDTTRLHEELH
jgi:DNA repair photolyase